MLLRHSGAAETDDVIGFRVLVIVSHKASLTVNIAGEWQFTIDLSTAAPTTLAAALA